MPNFFQNKYTDKIKGSPFIIPIFIVLIFGLIIGVGISIEDYSTSYYGYLSIPTRKVNTWIVPMVAALPQILQIIFAYAFMENTKNRWALLALLATHVIDVGTDVYYKSNKFASTDMVAYALIEAETIYTLGSEVLLTLTFGLLVNSFPSFVKQMNSVIDMLRDALPDGMTSFKTVVFGSILSGATIIVFLGLEYNYMYFMFMIPIVFMFVIALGVMNKSKKQGNQKHNANQKSDHRNDSSNERETREMIERMRFGNPNQGQRQPNIKGFPRKPGGKP